MNAVIYARVSSREQEDTGYSLPAQEKYLTEHARRNGFEIARVFAISESASGRVMRKAFHEMLQHVKARRINLILVESTDRLTRNFTETIELDRWILENPERQIHLAKEGCILHKESRSHEWFMWRVKVATAEYYVRLLSENVKKGQREKLSQGWLPTKPPLGYRTVGEKGHKVHVIDHEKAPLIRRMFEHYASGSYSLKRLVEAMYEDGLRTHGGNKLVKSRLADLLSDPFYCGRVRWNGEVYDGKHEALISPDLYERVQAMLKGKGAPKYQRHLYLFRGLIRCGECGGCITWEQQKGIVYGHCNRYRGCSQASWHKEREVEAQALTFFEGLEIQSPRLVDWIRRALKEGHGQEQEYHASALAGLNQRHEQLQRRLDRLYDDKLDGKISEEFYERRFREYAREKETVVRSIDRHSHASDRYFELGISLYELSQRARAIYQKAPVEEKRRLLSLVFEKLILSERKLQATYSAPFAILAQAVGATNGSNAAESSQSPSRNFEPPFYAQNRAKMPEIAKLLPRWDDFRTFKWVDELQDAEFVLKQAKQLLSLAD